MSIDFQTERHATYLECIITGDFELEEAKRVFVKLVDIWSREHPSKILIDIRQVVVTRPISLRDRFEFASHAVATAIHARARGLIVTQTVFLGTEDHIDSRQFGVLVAANRGSTVRSTTNRAEALAWLGVEETEENDPHRTTPARD